MFRHRDGVVPNLLAFAYAFGGYGAGWWLITRGAIAPAVAGTVLLAHAMVIAAYLVHECAHNTVLRDNALNARAGTAGSRNTERPKKWSSPSTRNTSRSVGGRSIWLATGS